MTLYERHKFWSLKQEEGEPLSAYSMRLKVQIDHCNYERGLAINSQN